MAIKRVIDIEVNTDEVQDLNKNLETSVETTNALKESFDDLNMSIEDSQKEAKKANNEISKSGKDASKSVGGISTAFKGLGLSIKAAGIGLLISAFATVKELLEQNQEVLDFFNTTFNFISIAVSDFSNFIQNNFSKATDEIADFFSLERLEEFAKSIVDNILERFRSLIEATTLLGRAFESLFKGDFDGALDNLKESGKELVDVMTGVDGSLDKIVETVTSVSESTGDYFNETLDAAKAVTQLTKSVELLEAQSAGLIAQYEREAEVQRQIRDDVNRSITERIEANNKLEQSLLDQEKVLIQNAETSLKLAQTNLKINDNQENRIALINAENNLLEIQERINGQLSEQKTNAVALENELRDLEQTAIEGQNERLIAENEFQAQRIEDEQERINQLLLNLEIEKEIENERLQNLIDNLAKGTQARADAEQELLNAQQEFNQREIELNDEKNKLLVESNQKASDSKKELQEQEIQTTSNTLGVISNLAGAFAGESEKQQERAFKVQKAANIAQATVDTYAAAVAAYKSFASVPPLAVAAAATAVAAGLANIKAIQSQEFSASSVSAPSIGSNFSAPQQQQAPQFNVVGASGINQIAQVLGNQPPVKAFVVGKDVTTQQELDRNIASNAVL